MPLWCTNRSLPWSSGVMNPKPFSSLNHFTVPVAIGSLPGEYVRAKRGRCGKATTTNAGTASPGGPPGTMPLSLAVKSVVPPDHPHVEGEHEAAQNGHDGEGGPDRAPLQVLEDQRPQALHHVGDRVERRRDLHRPRQQVPGHEVGGQEQEREEDQAAEVGGRGAAVLSAISCMKPTNTTDHSAVITTSSTKPMTPLAIVRCGRSAPSAACRSSRPRCPRRGTAPPSRTRPRAAARRAAGRRRSPAP